jgi:hypothetical protein
MTRYGTMTIRWRFTVLACAVGLATATGIAQVPGGGDAGVPTTPAVTSDAGISATTPLSPLPFEDGGTLSGEQYIVRLRDLEQRINELKEEIFRSKARLSLLAESVLGSVVGGSRWRVSHQNEMGGTYRLVSASYLLDGAPIFSRTDDGNGNLADQREFVVQSGQLPSGDHSLGVNLEYLGAGLPYMRGYRFRVRSTQSFTVPEGKAIQIRVVGYERGGPLEPPESRPAIRYVQRVVSVRDLEGENGESTEAADTQSGTTSAPTQGTSGSTNP